VVGGIVAVHCRWHGDDRTEDLRANQSHIIEAYKDTQRLAGESSERFAEVTFDLDSNALHSPRWRHIERADVEALIGGPASLPVERSY